MVELTSGEEAALTFHTGLYVNSFTSFPVIHTTILPGRSNYHPYGCDEAESHMINKLSRICSWHLSTNSMFFAL
jgi:hypothetical protein